MNKFDEKYNIRLATLTDINNIMMFIKENWKKNHIMSKDKELFVYEYSNNGYLNFVVAIDRLTDEIEAIFGFIYCSNPQFNPNPDIWGSMWMVKPDNVPLLGIELAKRVYKLTNCRFHIGNGANPNTTIPLRKIYFREKTGKMNQHYLLNPNIDDYNIAVINKKPIIYSNNAHLSRLVKFDSIDEIKSVFDIEKMNTIPYKDNWYFNRRYFSHPYYKYNVYGIKSNSNCVEALIVIRPISINSSKILRIVDYIGDHFLFSGLNKEFVDLLASDNYEYIDFYEFGFEKYPISQAGFTNRTEEDLNIIPNYFEPFLQENIDIWVHYKEEKTLFFKADGDQDRPNIIR